MKINNKFMICAVLVLMLLCISASSAAEPLTGDLGADIADDVAIDDVSNDALSASGGGDYGTNSAAVSDANGGVNVSTRNVNTDSLLSANSENFVGESNGNLNNVVTNDTFYSYFDEDGFLKDSITFKELIFNGTFSNVSDYIIINKAITIKGDNALLNDIAFVIDSEDVELNGLTLVANGSLGDLISVGASNVNLYNLEITYIVDDEMANAICVSAKGTLTDVNIVNNTIYFGSHVTTDEDLTTAINLADVEDILVDNNEIIVSYPGLYVETYDYTYFMMGLCYVNPVRIYEGYGVKFTNNTLDVEVNAYDASYPTIQALYIVGSEDVLIKGNNVTMKDSITPNGTAIYLYAVECGFSEDIAFIDNNFDISTTGGKSGAGSAYALQIATSSSEIIGNTILCDSNGPNLGIYSPYGFGPAKDLNIQDNYIEVAGYAAGTGDFALISGIEIQTGYATIYNNTIYSMNKGNYNEKYPVAAVSAVQYSASTLSFDIQDNEIYTNGAYAIDILYKVNNANITGNYLSANVLKGDEAVYIKSGTGNVIEGNYPIVGVVTNDTFFNFFDDAGVLKDDKNYYGLTFEGNFSNLVDTIIFNKAFKVYGNNTVLDNIAVRIEADDVELSGFTINANKTFADNNGAVIYATGSNIKLDDVVVNYTAPSEVEAIAIYANAAENFVLSNSEIIYVATNPGTKHNYGLEVRDSNNVLIENNTINATLPAVLVDYSSGATGIDQDLVLAVGIQGGENITFTSNVVTVNNNGGVDGYATVDAIMINSVDNLLINYNNISHIDTKTSDAIRCYNGIDLYAVTAIVENNNVLINTTSGMEGAGSAYPIQLTGPFTVVVNNNNLTTVSKGPNLGIFAANSWYVPGDSDLTVTNNFINVTGYAGTSSYALVSGIESQVAVSKIYNNTIYTSHIGDYADANYIFGISLAQYGTGSFDIKDNIITTDGKYTAYFGSVSNTNVTYNTLYAYELAGDDSVMIASGENNTVENNQPPFHFEVIVDVNSTWVGYDSLVKVTVTNATGALGIGGVMFTINGTTLGVINLVDGEAIFVIPAKLLDVGENEVIAEYVSGSPLYRSSVGSAKFQVVDGIVTQDNYLAYFNQADNGRLFDYVPEGATLDFQGAIINPDQKITVQMNVNKPVNIVSTTGDAYVDLNTTAGSLLGESPGNSFAITNGGSGSNVTGIYFHNTQMWISNTHDVVLDNISVVVEDQRVGSGVGATSIRDNSYNVVLKNSYLYTRNNGGSTTFTMSWTTNCTIDNCTVKAEGNVGNLIYLNVYNIVGAPSGVPLNNNNTVSNNRIYGKEGSGISVGLMVEGQNNLIINNTLYKSSISTSFGGQNPANNTYIGNVMTEGGSLSAQANSIVYGNNVTGTLTAGSNSIVFDNIVGKSMTVSAGATAYNNTVATTVSVAAGSTAYNNTVGTSMSVAAGAVAYDNIIGTSMTIAKDAIVYDNDIGTTVAINGANAYVENNAIGGAVTIAKAATNTTLFGNVINATVTVNSNDNNIIGNIINSTGDYAIDLKTATGNTVTDNYLVAKVYKGDAAVKYAGENIVEDNEPSLDITVAADAVWIGSNGTVVVNVVNGTGNVTIKVNNKTYIAELNENGTATKVIPVEELAVGANNVTVTYESAEYLPAIIDAVLPVLDGVITNATYEYYFDASGNLVAGVPDGVTLDFQGLFLGKYPVYINKAVNVVSSTGDALFDSGATYAGNAINSFNVIAGGDNTNITGLEFINYCLYIKGASNVTVDDISIVANKRGVGSGTGFLSIHTGAYNTLVKNSYFENGGTGSSLLVLGKGGAYATFDHNVFNITGSSGNILSANQYVGTGAAPEHVAYTNNVLYNSQPGSAFCYAMTVSGSGNLLENNTIYHNGSGILNQYGATSSGNVYRNNTLYGNTNFNPSANSIVENNKIYATTNIAANTTVVGNLFTNVAISGTNTTFANNEVEGTVTVSGNENTIVQNVIVSTGDYAVDLKTTVNNTVTDNYLVANLYHADFAVKYGDENIVEDNVPLADVTVIADPVWAGSNGDVIVNVVNGTGNVTIKVNNKTYIAELDENGTAAVHIPVEDLVVGANNVSATYESIEYPITTVDAVLAVLDGVVTQDTYMYYFNQEDNGRLFDCIPEGATLDFQGAIINPDQKITVQMNVNKPVNIISTTKDGYVDLNTTAGSLLGESPGNSFAVTRGGSGSNVTGIYFHNTQMWISNTSNVVLDNISVVVEDQRVGSGVGATSIRDNSSNVVLKNSYLYTRNNGGSTTFTMSWTTNCTIDNCTVKAEGNVGNLIYLNIFNIVGAPSGVPLNNNNTVSNNRIYGKEGSGISVGLMVEGTGNLIINNTLYKSSISTSFGGQKPANNTYVGNTLTQNGGLTAQTNSIVYDNNVTGALSTGTGSVVYDNIVGGKMTVAANAIAYGNTIGNGLTTGGTNAVIENNDIVGAVTINKVGTTFVGNDVNGTVTVSANNNVIEYNTIITTGNYAVDLGAKTGNNVTGNYLVANVYKGDAAVKFTNEDNLVEDNIPAVDITVVADAVWNGTNGNVIVNIVNGTGNVTIKVNNKTYIAELDENGTVAAHIPIEDLVIGANNVTVTYESAEFLPVTVDAVLPVLDGVITNATYEYYFDASGNLVAGVPDGVTLDFQGLFLGKYPVYINKAVNVVSSTGDALFDSGATYAGNAVNSFNIVAGGDNTNITGLDFINYCLYIKGASNVTVDDISIVANKRGVGSGTGFLSIHTGANNTLVKNSYFENGGTGSSLLVLGKGGAYATFDHNVFNITGSSGNILSANQYVGTGAAPEHVAYTNNVLYNSQPGSAFCYAMTVSGSGNLVENNTIYHNGSGILNQYGATSSGNVYRNNTLYGNTNFNPSANSIVENNKIYATTNIAANTTVTGNEFVNVAISGTNTTFTNNDVSGIVTVKGNENIIADNIVVSSGEYAVDLQSTANNTVTDNVLYAVDLSGDKAVKFVEDNNNTVADNYPIDPVLVVEANDIKAGENATIDIKFAENVTGIVEVILNGKEYSAEVTEGKGQLILPDLEVSKYAVDVIYYGGLLYIPTQNSTSFAVEKQETEVAINISDVKLGEDANVSISIPGATGNVSVIVDGVENVIPLDENGTALYTIPAMTAGDHSVVVVYAGDDTHAAAYKATPVSLKVTPTKFANITIFGDLNITAVLVDDEGSPVANAVIDYAVGNVTGSTVTGADGSFVIAGTNGALINIDYAGNGTLLATNTSIELKDVATPTPALISVKFNFTSVLMIKGYAVDTKAGEKGFEFITFLSDVDGNPLANKTVQLAVNSKVYDQVTNESGRVHYFFSMVRAGRYTMTYVFLGDGTYNSTLSSACVDLDKKPITIKASAKSYKASTKTKQYTVTLSTIAGVDGKVYLSPKKVTLKVNGKTYTGKTNSKGQVTFKITNLSKAGKYTAKISYAGDDTYKSASKSVKLTVN